MDTIPTLLKTLQAMSTGQPVGFALLVIIVMVTEGLLLVGLINLLLKIFSGTGSRTGRSR